VIVKLPVSCGEHNDNYFNPQKHFPREEKKKRMEITRKREEDGYHEGGDDKDAKKE
jgi:hypothetical protein